MIKSKKKMVQIFSYIIFKKRLSIYKNYRCYNRYMIKSKKKMAQIFSYIIFK